MGWFTSGCSKHWGTGSLKTSWKIFSRPSDDSSWLTVLMREVDLQVNCLSSHLTGSLRIIKVRHFHLSPSQILQIIGNTFCWFLVVLSIFPIFFLYAKTFKHYSWPALGFGHDSCNIFVNSWTSFNNSDRDKGRTCFWLIRKWILFSNEVKCWKNIIILHITGHVRQICYRLFTSLQIFDWKFFHRFLVIRTSLLRPS